MKKFLYGCILIIFIVTLILLLFAIKKGNHTIIELENNDILNNITKDGAAILYTKKINDTIKGNLDKIYKEYKVESYYSELNYNEVNDLLENKNIKIDTDELFIIFMNGEVVDCVSVNDEKKLVELLEKYLYNKIPENERAYKVVSTASEYIKKVNSKNYTVAVFGKNNCTYCDLYLPIINDIASNYNLDIYYFNRDEYDEDEYDKIMELDFEIPAKCTTTGYSTTMKKSFPKPMTIITKDGKFVDCIRGYVTENEVKSILGKYKLIKE